MAYWFSYLSCSCLIALWMFFIFLLLRGQDQVHEDLVVDFAVRVDVDALEELVDLGVGELLAQVGEDVAELALRDEAGAVLVKDLEAVDELVAGACGLEAVRAHQDLDEGVKVDGVGLCFCCKKKKV